MHTYTHTLLGSSPLQNPDEGTVTCFQNLFVLPVCVACLVCQCSGLITIPYFNEVWVHLLPLEVGGTKKAGKGRLAHFSFLSCQILQHSWLSDQQIQYSLSNYTGSWILCCHHSTPVEVTKTNLFIGID